MEFTEADRELFTLRRWAGPTADRIADLVAASGLDATAFAEAAGVDAKRVARLLDRAPSAPSGFDQVAITPPGDSDHAGLRIEAKVDTLLPKSVKVDTLLPRQAGPVPCATILAGRWLG